ncbi:MAG: DUF4124 domain-containing protein [Pseudomonadota bacterium]|nr:DUF4124 domain-containing protein [Pseudomonadota bacterium]
MFKSIYVCILLFAANSIAHAEIYQWTDTTGQTHYTDSSKVIDKNATNRVQIDQAELKAKTKNTLNPFQLQTKEHSFIKETLFQTISSFLNIEIDITSGQVIYPDE